MLVSIVIRTLNEEKYLDELLGAINFQEKDGFNSEVVIVDSGSTDKTLEIARKYNSRVTYIDKKEFSFGKSLNIGCDYADGEYLVFISGHCIPEDKYWLKNLVDPLIKQECDYVYGRQIGRDTTKFSENQVFKKYFPEKTEARVSEIFCNNANSAITRAAWDKYKFNEELTGLEDLFMAKEIVQDNGKVDYIPRSVVFHIHDETWAQVKTRYERESIALQKIMPEVKVSLFDTLNFILTGIFGDMVIAFHQRVLLKELRSIILFRIMQYYGAFKGNHLSRKLSYKSKMKYFYPKIRNDC
ncbi:glycosyltransferase [Gammaproteobacteria bacterium]|nr:glycosyltransferase [Gammaproteobacteria bacterium]